MNHLMLDATDSLEARYARLQPALAQYAPLVLGRARCPHRQAEALAEFHAMAWGHLCRLAKRDIDPSRFALSFAYTTARQVRAGRRLCRQDSAADPLSWIFRARHGVRLDRLTRASQGRSGVSEALVADARSPVPERASFRLAFPPFLRSLSRRDRRLALFLGRGHTGKEAARRFGLSPGRITQLRQRWCQQWRQLNGERVVD